VSAFEPGARRDIAESLSGELRAMRQRGRTTQLLLQLLEPGEQVAFTGLCSPASSWWREAVDVHLCVATDRRMLLIPAQALTSDAPPKHPLADEPRSIRYRDILSVNPDFGLFESKLTIDVDDESIRLHSMRRKSARAVAAAIRQHTAR
jgi:hypothetical protein